MARYSLHAADQVVIAGYFLLLAAVGFYFWRRMRNVRDLFTGGNNIPWWLAGVSFYLTAFSAFTFVAYSEIAYRYGIVALTLTWSSVVSMIVGTIFLAGRWRRARIISPVEFLEARYSPQIRQALAWAGLPLKLIDDGLKIYVTGIFISAGLGYDLRPSVIGSGVVMSLYKFMGGLWAVVVTDYVQFVILIIGVAVLFPIVVSHMAALFSLFVGPVLPMLAGLLSRRLTWRGATAGIIAGFISGFSLYLYKTLVLVKQVPSGSEWLRYDFEGISILVISRLRCSL
jgi:solute:Na+ symporter, SSS family